MGVEHEHLNWRSLTDSLLWSHNKVVFNESATRACAWRHWQLKGCMLTRLAATSCDGSWKLQHCTGLLLNTSNRWGRCWPCSNGRAQPRQNNHDGVRGCPCIFQGEEVHLPALGIQSHSRTQPAGASTWLQCQRRSWRNPYWDHTRHSCFWWRVCRCSIWGHEQRGRYWITIKAMNGTRMAFCCCMRIDHGVVVTVGWQSWAADHVLVQTWSTYSAYPH